MRLNPICFIIVILTATSFAHAERIELDRPLKLLTHRSDRSQISGHVVAFDDAAFELRDATGQVSTVQWDELEPVNVMQVHERLLTNGTAGQWLALGERLWSRRGGKGPADRAFAKAMRLDPSTQARVEKIRGKPVRAGDGASTAPSPVEAKSGVPPTVGPVDATMWGQLSEKEQSDAIEELKQFAQQAQTRLNKPLALYETEYFLFYSDLPSGEAKNWAGLLDRMYAQLAELFGVTRGENIWRGKALVYVFSTEQAYLAYEKTIQHVPADGTAGMCHNFGNGNVQIAFYRQESELDFASVLVHESVHGFLHRYRKPVHVPSFANEGLAEVIASELVPHRGRKQQIMQDARSELQQRKSVGDFFDAERIEGWQYPVAQTLCEFMIMSSRKGYVDFINGIKDGLTWEQSLQQKYGTTQERLVPAYGEWLDVRGLTAP